MSEIQLTLNGEKKTVTAPPMKRLLDVLREDIHLTGVKEGCGEGECGSCSVLMNGELVNSCLVPILQAEGAHITTIEGLSPDGMHPVQVAWEPLDVPQCGYCQAGQIMSATALLDSNPHPDDSDIDAAMAGNLCRCGTYIRIRRAIKNAAARSA